MLRCALIVMVVMMGCALDPHRHDRPARLRIGTNGRRISAPATDPVALRSGTSETPRTAYDALTFTGQFTLTGRSLYVGGEAETGRLDATGSNLAGAYAIAGVQHLADYGSLAAEFAAGWRSLRFSLDNDGASTLVLEPRLRAEIWMSSQLSLGATTGATLGEQGGWMAGLYLGIHSHLSGMTRVD